MHRLVLGMAVGFVALSLGRVTAATWEIDPSHTSVGFSISHMTVARVHGTFRDIKGSARGEVTDPAGAQIEAVIEVASVDTGNAKRDAHLREPDFFDAARYPKMTFTSTRIEKVAEGRWNVAGDLTLHGVKREIVLDVEGPTAVVKDRDGNLHAGARATGRLDRRDFDLRWSKVLEAGGLVVGNDVDLVIDVEAVQRPGG